MNYTFASKFVIKPYLGILSQEKEEMYSIVVAFLKALTYLSDIISWRLHFCKVKRPWEMCIMIPTTRL